MRGVQPVLMMPRDRPGHYGAVVAGVRRGRSIGCIALRPRRIWQIARAGAIIQWQSSPGFSMQVDIPAVPTRVCADLAPGPGGSEGTARQRCLKVCVSCSKPTGGTQMQKAPHPPVWRLRGYGKRLREQAFAPPYGAQRGGAG